MLAIWLEKHRPESKTTSRLRTELEDEISMLSRKKEGNDGKFVGILRKAVF